MRTWKKPGILFVSGLILIILVLPTLIVIPFIGSNAEQQAQPVVATPTESAQGNTLADNPALMVSVLRSQTEEVDEVPLELYVARVVASEMPADFELEALKAQALAARTYIVQYLSNDDSSQVTDTVNHQVYKNDEELRVAWGTDYDWKMSKIEQAVSETKGEIITYQEKPITAAFFSTSNGYTENSEDYWPNKIPYLRSVESPWDAESPKYVDQQVFTKQQIEDKLEVAITSNQPALSNISKTDSERVSTVTIGGKSFTGREIREALALNSSDFSVKYKNEHIIFTTKGYGHGIGMSQYGANGMAQEGNSYQDIVAHYYKDVKISQIDSYLPKLASK
ncbi:stage II sporulation protein D [Pontibacillus salicampi]|uniref:Stage II sporulation protein D n=1 Tax=Pontibacillus salicampi TaxID=1449801 RepID=A0ABV6LSE6_9BACI